MGDRNQLHRQVSAITTISQCRFMKVANDFKAGIGFKGTLLLELQGAHQAQQLPPAANFPQTHFLADPHKSASRQLTAACMPVLLKCRFMKMTDDFMGSFQGHAAAGAQAPGAHQAHLTPPAQHPQKLTSLQIPFRL
jgi:hypothetical protein